MHPLLLRLHRILFLVFAAPLVVVVVTGLIISFDPILAARSVPGGPLTMEAFEPVLRRADPDGRAGGIAIDAQAGSFTLGGRGGARYAIATGETLPDEAPGLTRWVRGLHQRLMLNDLGEYFGQRDAMRTVGEFIVIASTIALTLLVVIGLFLGLPKRLRSTMLGWHKGIGWVLAPLLVLSPATGVMMAYGWFVPPRGGDRVPPPASLTEAVRIVAAQHDLNAVVWIRRRGPNVTARVRDGGEWRSYAVGREGLVPQPRNWPRLLHEGNWGGALSGWLNVVVSVAFLGLLGTGGVVWYRRRRLRRDAQARRLAAEAAAAAS